MVALQEDRAGFVHIIVDLPSGALGAFHVVVDFHAVKDHRNPVSDDRSLRRLPFAARLGDELVGSFETIKRAVAALGRLAIGVVTKNLNLMTAAQIEAAVGAIGVMYS